MRRLSSVAMVGILLAGGCTAAPASAPTPTGTGAVDPLAGTATARSATSTPRGSPSPTVRPSPSRIPAATAATTAAESPSYAPPSTAADGTTFIDLPPFPMIVIVGDDALWASVIRPDGRDILRIDPLTNTFEPVVTDLPVTQDPIHGMAVNGSIWVSGWDTDAVTEYDATTGEVLATHEVGVDPVEPVLAYGDVWILNHHDASVSRIDAETKTVVVTIDLPSTMHPLALHAGGGLLWVGGPRSADVHAIDPETNSVVRTHEVATDCVQSVAHIGDRIWVGYCDRSGLEIFDPKTGDPLTVLEAKVAWPHVAGLVVDERVWLPWIDPAEGDFVDRLVAIDTTSVEIVEEVRLPDRIAAPSIVAGFDSLWIGTEGGMVRVPADALPGLRH